MGNPLSKNPSFDVEILRKTYHLDAFNPDEQHESEERYNEVQFKAAHNSYQRNENIFQQLDLKDGGCGAIELDFVVDPKSINDETWTLGVQHDDEYHPSSPSMTGVFNSLKEWSDNHKDHEVVTIHLDMKHGGAMYGVHDRFATELDNCIKKGLGEDKVFTPSQLQRDANTLVEGAQKYGWPKMKDLRGKFILVITGDDTDSIVRARRNTYCNLSPHDRMCFVDIDQRAFKFIPLQMHSLTSLGGDRVFVNIQLGRDNWLHLGRACFDSGVFVSRVWKANKEIDFLRARSAGIHFIATDKIRHHPWAYVSNVRPFARIQKFDF